MRGGEYIKITGTVIAFYINVLFKSFPQCESPSLKRINSLHTNLFCACRWSIMKAPPSTPDQETSGCHLTQLRGLSERGRQQPQGPGVCEGCRRGRQAHLWDSGPRGKPHHAAGASGAALTGRIRRGGAGAAGQLGAGEGRHLAGCWGIRPQARLQGAWRMMAHDKAPGGYRCEWLVLHWRKLPVASRSALSPQVPKCSPASGR